MAPTMVLHLIVPPPAPVEVSFVRLIAIAHLLAPDAG
tara:strand:+ start:2985 stop:3095 length:111 start_codon:yes stop_codon:yes gene_type:complete